MRALRTAVVLVLALALPAAVLVAVLQASLEVYNRGDNATALQVSPEVYKRGADATALGKLRALAEQGDAGAQSRLGIMYTKGTGVPQNVVLAHMWLNLAVVGFPPGEDRKLAVGNRGDIEKRMTPAQLAGAQRLAREWKPK